MDIWKLYKDAVNIILPPQAKVVVDKFHVFNYF
ncbi:transposase [Cytobacillus sp. Sa5YUA1]|uniref:Transposase n=1 Tax=Cytobacillus stercorigallinarum TaxID=2762240 RepID=A0ABR8QKS6_9BACI|nr:transposase [Cytobacillus stercorigallinarum]